MFAKGINGCGFLNCLRISIRCFVWLCWRATAPVRGGLVDLDFYVPWSGSDSLLEGRLTTETSEEKAFHLEPFTAAVASYHPPLREGEDG